MINYFDLIVKLNELDQKDTSEDAILAVLTLQNGTPIPKIDEYLKLNNAYYRVLLVDYEYLLENFKPCQITLTVEPA